MRILKERESIQPILFKLRAQIAWLWDHPIKVHHVKTRDKTKKKTNCPVWIGEFDNLCLEFYSVPLQHVTPWLGLEILWFFYFCEKNRIPPFPKNTTGVIYQCNSWFFYQFLCTFMKKWDWFKGNKLFMAISVHMQNEWIQLTMIHVN